MLSMNLRSKLLLGFILTAFVTLGVGIFAVSKMMQIDAAGTVLYEKRPHLWQICWKLQKDFSVYA